MTNLMHMGRREKQRERGKGRKERA